MNSFFGRLGSVLAVASTAPAFADVAFTTGSMVEVFAPYSFVTGENESSSAIAILDEGLTLLPSDVELNVYTPGTHGDNPPPYLIVPAGTLVQTYLVHFDPTGTSFATLTGSVVFEPGEVIIGLQTHTPLLYVTDPLVGHPLATYPAVFDDFRGFETLPGPDSVTLPLTMASASFTLFAELGVDHARIFTIPVPSPSTLAAVMSVGALGAIRRRRDAV
ncbi:MAG: hypothetical protein AMXMBFR58_02970 [Phycisphaerae bacterium]|nr:hypothetical protein [Phycisphaerales bacterium]